VQIHQLDVAFFSHFHVDYSSDLPVLISSSWFEDRKRTLPVLGPPVNAFTSSTTELVHDLFSGPHGAWRDLSELKELGTEES
jgi:ribonuclease BN (tRNA processing enzyme)